MWSFDLGFWGHMGQTDLPSSVLAGIQGGMDIAKVSLRKESRNVNPLQLPSAWNPLPTFRKFNTSQANPES